MLDFDTYREPKNGKWYKTNSAHTKSENDSVEDNRAGNSSKNTKEKSPENRTLIQEVVNEQSKQFIAHFPVS